MFHGISSIYTVRMVSKSPTNCAQKRIAETNRPCPCTARRCVGPGLRGLQLEERLIAKVRTEQEEEEEERCHGVAIDAGSQSPSTSFMGAFWRIMQCPISALSKRSSRLHARKPDGLEARVSLSVLNCQTVCPNEEVIVEMGL